MKKTKKDSNLSLEIVGAIYTVEKFPNGLESREEIDGKLILELVLWAIEEGVNTIENKQTPGKQKKKV